MPQTYTISQESLLKVLLHAAKYPANSVNGVLIGKAADTSSSTSDVTVDDVIPLLHTNLTLAPAMEIALTQMDGYAKSIGDVIIGYYHAESRAATNDMSPVGRRLAERINSKHSASCVLLVDATRLDAFCTSGDGCPVDLMTKDPSKGWKRSPSAELVLTSGNWKSLHERFMALFTAQAHHSLVDFDSHLDDISLDYLNKKLFA